MQRIARAQEVFTKAMEQRAIQIRAFVVVGSVVVLKLLSWTVTVIAGRKFQILVTEVDLSIQVLLRVMLFIPI